MTTTTLALGRPAQIGEVAERERKLRELAWVCVICARNPSSTGRRMTAVATIIAEQRRRRSRVSDNAQPHYREAAVVGGGVIGVSWSALFLAHGLGVTVADPLPDIADRVRAGLGDRRPWSHPKPHIDRAIATPRRPTATRAWRNTPTFPR